MRLTSPRGRSGSWPALVVAAVLAGAGCGSAGTSVTTYACQPACPAGTHCDQTGCVPDGPGPDLAASGADLAASCECGGATPYCNPQGVCVSCLADASCPAGQVCRQAGGTAVCVAGCADDDRCTDGGKQPTSKCCAGQCVDTATDLQNCGACGQPCAPAHAGAACSAGTCVPAACAAGWGDCNHSPDDGCETSVSVDPKNCGTCGSTCAIANAIAGCAGSCYIAGCQFGYDDCNGDLKDGCETSVLSDPKNCAACGQSCPRPPHAAATCVNAACALTQCDTGFADCDGNAGNGCESSVFTDAANCGACGAACAQGLVCRNGGCTCPMCNFNNASSKCLNNVCVLDKCVPGFGDCDLAPGNGCEDDLSSDKNNCGACGVACINGQNCFDGVCLDKFVFQLTQQIDGQTVTCSKVDNNNVYAECDDLQENGMYFPNGIQCGPLWSMGNPRLSDSIGFCQALTGTAKAENYFTCSNSITRATWQNHVWGTTVDNGYTQHVRCYY